MNMMKAILRRFSLSTIDTFEKENNEIIKISEDPLCLLNNSHIHPETVPKIDSILENRDSNLYERKYSLPSKVLSKISLLTKKTSVGDEQINEKERLMERWENCYGPNENIRVKIDEVRLRPVDVKRESSDVPLRCHRLSEINFPTNNDGQKDRICRRSVVNMDRYRTMSNREKRHSLSEFGFGKIESYIKYEVLGKGSYSTVFKGRSLLTNDVVALKEVKLEQEEGAPCSALREISLLRDLRHPNIVTLHDIIYQKNRLTLIFEYVEKNLKQYMEERDNNLDMSIIKCFMRQLLSSLDFCHYRRILHRDLKPQNLLISEKDELKLADFGLARAKSFPIKTYSSEVVTLWYRPPDLLLGKTDYSGHIDIWGAGCIFVEMMNGEALFQGHSEKYQLNFIFEKLGSLSNTEWDSLDLKEPRFLSNDFVHTPKPSSLEHLIRRIDHVEQDSPINEFLCGFLHLIGENRFTANAALHHLYLTKDNVCLKALPAHGHSHTDTVENAG